MPASFRRLIRSAGPLLRAWSTSAAREAGVAALAIVAFGAAIADAPDWLVFTLALLTLAATVVFGWEQPTVVDHRAQCRAHRFLCVVSGADLTRYGGGPQQ